MEIFEPLDTGGIPEYLIDCDERGFRNTLEGVSGNLYEMAAIIHQAMDYCRGNIDSNHLRDYCHDVSYIPSSIDPEEESKKKNHPGYYSYTVSNYMVRISYIAEHYINTYYKNKPVNSITIEELSLFPPSDRLLDGTLCIDEWNNIVGKIRIDKYTDINELYRLLKGGNIVSGYNEIPKPSKDPLYIALKTRKKLYKAVQ